MIQKGLIDEFISVQLYPEGNLYQKEKSKEYLEQISEQKRNQFLPITYEQFIQTGKSVFKGKTEFEHWLDYLQQRYIVTIT